MPPVHVVSVGLVSDETLGSLDFQIDYSAAAGEFLDPADTVMCETVPGETTSVYNNIVAKRLLLGRIIAVGGFSGPGEIARCRFQPAPSTTPESGDFSVAVTDAADPDLMTIDSPPPDVRVLSVEPEVGP